MAIELRRPERTFTIRQLCLEFKVTPRALRFYEDKGLLSPARDGQARIYSHRDRARLILILRGKRVGLSLSDIRDLLDLYKVDEDGAVQASKILRKFQERIVALAELHEGVERLQTKLAETRPDLLPQADNYHAAMGARLDGVH
jgi:DNA-binding transcriptional MerR regulator